jgi:hypothetical protein
MTQTSPDAVVISLGANMLWMTPAQVASSAATLAKIATGGGAKLVWVGPPPQKSDIADRSDYDAFCSRLGAAVAPYGAFINSSPFVPTYAGTDGIHYNDARGAAIATAWADDVFGVMYPASTAPASAAPSLGELVAWVSLATVTVFGARHALKRLRHRVAVVH